MQNAARKTLNYLQASYQFTVYDVNYEAMQRAWAECSRRCKKCELLRSKIATQDKGKAIVKYSRWRLTEQAKYGSIASQSYSQLFKMKANIASLISL